MGLLRSIAALISPSSKRSSDSDARHVLGRQGERVAVRWLKKHGFRVLYRNYRAKSGGEVDIVCRDLAAGELVFVEVKTRSSRGEFDRPADAVTLEKQELIARGARSWLRLLDRPEVTYRFDIVEVIMTTDQKPEVTHLRSAFVLPETRRH